MTYPTDETRPDTADRALAVELSRAHARISTLEWLLRTAGVPAPHPQGGTEELRAQIEVLRVRSREATPGPWRGRYGTMSPRGSEVWGQSDIEDGERRVLHDADTLRDADWQLIIAAVNYVRTLLAAAPAPTEVGDQ